MDFRIVWTRPDGGTSIMAPAASEGRTVEDCMKKVPADAINVEVVPTEALLAAVGNDRWFRMAWTHSKDKGVHIPMDKAKEAHRNRIRDSRNFEMDKLDREQVRHLASKNPNKVDEIEARKQVLRDAPNDPRIDTAQTLAELKAVWPEGLERLA